MEKVPPLEISGQKKVQVKLQTNISDDSLPSPLPPHLNGPTVQRVTSGLHLFFILHQAQHPQRLLHPSSLSAHQLCRWSSFALVGCRGLLATKATTVNSDTHGWVLISCAKKRCAHILKVSCGVYEAQHQNLNRFSHLFLPRHHGKALAGQRHVPLRKARGHLGIPCIQGPGVVVPSSRARWALTEACMLRERKHLCYLWQPDNKLRGWQLVLCPREEAKREPGMGRTGLCKTPLLIPPLCPTQAPVTGAVSSSLKFPLS